MQGAWLSDDEQQAWRTYLRMSSLLPAALNRELQQDSGLTLPEYEVLVQLSETPQQRLRPFQICEALNWEQSGYRISSPGWSAVASSRARSARPTGVVPSSSSPTPAPTRSARPRRGTSRRCGGWSSTG